jgi:hypothetical protein
VRVQADLLVPAEEVRLRARARVRVRVALRQISWQISWHLQKSDSSALR